MIHLTGSSLTVEQLIAIADAFETVDLPEEAAGRVSASRAVVDRHASGTEAVYGVNTGFGALAETATGNGSRLLALSDDYTQRSRGGHYSNATAALSAVGCLDSAAPPDLAAVRKLAADAAKVAPRFGPSTIYLGLPCTYWPVEPKGVAKPIHAPDAPPIVVVGATNDPATPYNWARALSSGWPSTSRPASSGGIVAAWIGDGVS